MYLSAQKVRDAAGHEGVNIFVYTHRGVAAPGVDWKVPDAGYVADHCPGKLLAAVRAVVAKQARVLTFLDAAVADDINARTVASLLQSAASRWPGHSAKWHAGPLGLRFFAVRSLRDGKAETEFRELKDALLPVLGMVVSQEQGSNRFPVRPPQPLVIERHRTPVGYRFELSREAAQLLVQAGILPGARSVSVSTENLDAFEIFTQQDIEEQALRVLTGLRLDQVDALAGAVVLDVVNAQYIWRSPGATSVK